MKLLLENFKRFLEESYSEEESKYFKNLPQIAEQISKAFDRFLIELESSYNRKPVITDIQKNMPKFVQYVVADTGGMAQYVGHGKFRCVFDVGDDYIIKFDITSNRAAKEQNITDAQLGKSTEYADLFPRAAIDGDDYRWVALEKATPFKTFDADRFNSFFPNDVIDSWMQVPVIKTRMITFSFVYNSGDRERAFELYHGLYSWIKGNKPQIAAKLLEPLDDYYGDEEPNKITFREICHGFGQHALYDKVMSAIQKLGIRPEEIRLDNTGLSNDGRFIIIDSSIHEQIVGGFKKDSKPALNNPIPAGKTQSL
jgi:hypothetical protein